MARLSQMGFMHAVDNYVLLACTYMLYLGNFSNFQMVLLYRETIENLQGNCVSDKILVKLWLLYKLKYGFFQKKKIKIFTSIT